MGAWLEIEKLGWREGFQLKLTWNHLVGRNSRIWLDLPFSSILSLFISFLSSLWCFLDSSLKTFLVWGREQSKLCELILFSRNWCCFNYYFRSRSRNSELRASEDALSSSSIDLVLPVDMSERSEPLFLFGPEGQPRTMVSPRRPSFLWWGTRISSLRGDLSYDTLNEERAHVNLHVRAENNCAHKIWGCQRWARKDLGSWPEFANLAGWARPEPTCASQRRRDRDGLHMCERFLDTPAKPQIGCQMGCQ